MLGVALKVSRHIEMVENDLRILRKWIFLECRQAFRRIDMEILVNKVAAVVIGAEPRASDRQALLKDRNIRARRDKSFCGHQSRRAGTNDGNAPLSIARSCSKLDHQTAEVELPED